MSLICRHLLWNNNLENKDKKIKIDEELIWELCPRVLKLTEQFDVANQDDKERCFL